MKKLFLMFLAIIFSFTMISCGNRSEKFNDYIESFEFEDNNIMFYNTEHYYVQGVFYDYEDDLKDFLIDQGYRVNRALNAKHIYFEDEYMYVLVIHYGQFEDVYSDSVIDESLVRINLETHIIEMMYDFGTININTANRLIGISNHQYFIYREFMKVHVIDMESDEIIEVFPYTKGEAYQYQDHVLTVLSEDVLQRINFETNERVQQSVDYEYDMVTMYDEYIHFSDGLNQATILDMNTFEEVSTEVFEAYLESKEEYFKIGNAYHEMAIHYDNYMIGDLEITLEEFVDEMPILAGLKELDSKNKLRLKFCNYVYLNETTFLMGVEHYESGFMTVDEAHRMIFKYEIGVGISYLGYVDSNEDVMMLQGE
ncbi:MAG: hypothetical protein KKH92_03700 [Firmicutes bacterium]|nr:hypothetical protein [Bacillota bacterium]